MQKRQVLINAIFSVIQIVVIGVVLFVLYRFLLNTIGVKQLGIWSLVLATSSVAQVTNFGLAGSAVKFVAKYTALEESENVSGVIQTAAISMAFIAAFVLLIAYPIIKKIFTLVVPPESLPLAIEILPYAFLALWFVVVTGVFQAALDGRQRVDIRSSLLMGSAVLNLILCFILVPVYGLLGVAYARVLQVLTMFLVSWVLLKRYVTLPLIPYRWDKRLFKEIAGYGISFQIISITSMFYDPVTKALLSKFGNLAMVGYYEMASRMIQQFRALVVSANQVLVPAIADLKERTPEKIDLVYLKSYQLLFYLIVPLFSLIIISLPLISKIWIGHYENVFIIIGILLIIGWFLNTLNAPAYFAYLGIGELYWNVIGHITIGVLNICLGFLLGMTFDGIGVVVAWTISLALGSSIIYLSYHIKHNIPLIELLPKASRMMIATCLIGILSTLIIQHKLNHIFNASTPNTIILFLFSIVVFIFLWLHPMRKCLVGWISKHLLQVKSP